MSRLAGFYIAKAIESAPRGTSAAATSHVPPRRTANDNLVSGARKHDSNPTFLERVFAAVHRSVRGPAEPAGATDDR